MKLRNKKVLFLMLLALLICLPSCAASGSDSGESPDASASLSAEDLSDEDDAGLPTGPDCDLNSPAAIIAVEVGTSTEEAAREAYPDATYIYVNSASDGLLAVTSGKASA